MDSNISVKLQKELSYGEQLLWSGQPRQGVVLRKSDALIIPLSLLWSGFAFFWEYSTYKSGSPIFLLIFGGVFSLIGLYFIFGRFIGDFLHRKQTYYGVTNHRVIILSEFPIKKLQSLNLQSLIDITFLNKSDGSGSIIFGQQHPLGSFLHGILWPGIGQYQNPSFELITNVKSVYEIIHNRLSKSI